jgi:hypothetical protein
MDYGQVRMIEQIRIDKANIRRFSFIANKQLFLPSCFHRWDTQKTDICFNELIISIRCFRPVVGHFPQIAQTRLRVFNADRADFLISFI